MKERQMVVSTPLNQNDCVDLARVASRYSGDVFILSGSRRINAKSMMGLIGMGLKKGDAIAIVITGDDADEMLDRVAKFFG